MVEEILLTISLLVAVIVFYFYTRALRLKNEISKPLPIEWEKIIHENVGFYHTLSEPLKERFKARIRYFMVTTPVYGYQTPIDDKIKILVAASSVMLTLSFKNWHFRYLDAVEIVDGTVSRNESTGNIVTGQVMTMGNRCKMTLSKQALLQGFQDMNDRTNVGVHEFAHILDQADGAIDGIPASIMAKPLIEQWSSLMKRKIDEIYDKKSDINPYGATKESEFFAVVTEYFFEKPDKMKRKHPELYKILAETFQQDNSSSFMVNFKELMGQVRKRIGRNAPCPCGSGKKFKKCCLNE